MSDGRPVCPKCGDPTLSHAYRPATKRNDGRCLSKDCTCEGAQ